MSKFDIGNLVTLSEKGDMKTKLGIGTIFDVEIDCRGFGEWSLYYINWGKQKDNNRTFYYLDDEIELADGYSDFIEKIKERLNG